MEKCPEKELLEQFIDYGLTEEMNEKILTHLSLCNKCRDTIRCLLTEDEKLIKELLTEPVTQERKALPLPEHLSSWAILAYTNECLNEDQLKLVESHLEKCDNCMFELVRIQRLANSLAALGLDMANLKVSKDALSNKESGVLEIIMEAKDNILELIEHTGELLSLTPQLSAVRGKAYEAEDAIVIRKDFKEKDLSIEITIKKELTETEGFIRLSALKLSNEYFLSGMDIFLSGKNIQQYGRTNEHGIVEFSGIKKGRYDIKVAEEKVALITIR